MRHWHPLLVLALILLAFPAAANGQGDALPETFTVDARSDAAQFTDTVLQADSRYTLVATGTSSVWSDESGVIDALYCFESQRCENRGTIPVRFPKPRINDLPIDEFIGREGGVPYEADHRYELEFTGVAGKLKLTYFDDGNLADNSGSYQVTIDEADGETCDGPFEPSNGGREIVGNRGDNTLVGTDGDDVICGGGGDDTILGGKGKDVILGEGGNDKLFGEEDPDLHLGGKGNDRISDPERGELDTFSGGPGNDWLIYDGRNRTAGVIAKIGGVGGEAEGDEIKDSIENLRGTDFDDKLTGNGKKNKLRGGDGADRLKGKGKKDDLRGGGEDDIIEGGPGPDELKGGSGDDDLFGDGGRDFLFGQTDNDNLFAKDRRVDRRINGGSGDQDFAEFDRAERRRLRSIEIR